jgi:hypothetical protein
MINRPKNLELIECCLTFNDRNFDRVEIDLLHINRHERSHFLAHEAFLILERFVDGASMGHLGERTYVNGVCRYYQETGQVNGKCYKVVFCVCSDRPNAIGLMTLHRIKEKK